MVFEMVKNMGKIANGNKIQAEIEGFEATIFN